jgi:hypothetical protein
MDEAPTFRLWRRGSTSSPNIHDDIPQKEKAEKVSENDGLSEEE